MKAIANLLLQEKHWQMFPSAIRLCVFVAAISWGYLEGLPAVQAQLSTDDRLSQPAFWPRKSIPSAADFAGTAACASCHSAIATSQRTTAMALTATLAKNSTELRAHPSLVFGSGPYRYEIRTENGESAYFVANGVDALRSTLVWAFGSGPVGQTYLFKQHNENLYEARVSYFGSLKGLHFTPGFVLTSSLAFESAATRYIDPEETVRCFSCHTTNSTIGGKFDEKQFTLGITCEACHGPGQKHVDTMLTAKIQGIDDVREKGIFNPATLKPADALDFCGACHGSLWDVVLTVPKGTQTSRFQPYWLQQSKCWGENGDARLTCTVCHDPHKPLETDAESYDKACLSCHPASNPKDVAKPSGRACPVSAKNCVTCHMPSVYSPEMHHTFRDHQIRIVRQPGEKAGNLPH